MKIALIGATGQVGSRLLAEALQRGHQVSAIARRAAALAPRAGLTPIALDVADTGKLTAALAGHDVAIVSVKYSVVDASPILKAIEQADVQRVLVVGGAGSLQVAPGVDLVDTPTFHDAYKGEALAAREILRQLRAGSPLDWTLVSPSALLVPGERTGKFRIGGNDLLVDANGASSISIEDLAVALIDELETPRHSRQRFTVGY
ncbi:MAG: NAD(P)-dependent oxidoreductase [Proteobacteria bacterium]|nr:NAD(P)-dependent oxidoreductase [Pseudomonadota bacterium]